MVKTQITKRHINTLSKKIINPIIGNLIRVTDSNYKTGENSLNYTSDCDIGTVKNNSCLDSIVGTI